MAAKVCETAGVIRMYPRFPVCAVRRACGMGGHPPLLHELWLNCQRLPPSRV